MIRKIKHAFLKVTAPKFVEVLESHPCPLDTNVDGQALMLYGRTKKGQWYAHMHEFCVESRLEEAKKQLKNTPHIFEDKTYVLPLFGEDKLSYKRYSFFERLDFRKIASREDVLKNLKEWDASPRVSEYIRQNPLPGHWSKLVCEQGRMCGPKMQPKL